MNKRFVVEGGEGDPMKIEGEKGGGWLRKFIVKKIIQKKTCGAKVPVQEAVLGMYRRISSRAIGSARPCNETRTS